MLTAERKVKPKNTIECRKDQKTRVLHIVHWPKSGIVSFLFNVMNASVSKCIEYHVVFFLGGGYPGKDVPKNCVSIQFLDFKKSFIKSIKRLRSIILDIKPDVIHTHSFQPGIWARLSSIFTSSKIISTVHCPYPYFCAKNIKDRFKRFVETSTINFFNFRVICVSDAIKNHLLKWTSIDCRKLIVIKAGVKVNKKRSEEGAKGKLREELIIKNKYIISTVGRLSVEKGYDSLLEAFKLLRSRIEECYLLIIGDGVLLRQLKKLARRLGIQDNTIFLGYVKDVYPFLEISSVYVCSSRYEGLPISILEAMSMEVPVVATAVGGIPELIENNVSGFLVEPDRPDMMADRLQAMLENKDFRKRIGKEGKRKVIQEFEIDKVVEAIESLYMEIGRR
jgi:glycosyltransferase involved in cell wall biosynthesis